MCASSQWRRGVRSLGQLSFLGCFLALPDHASAHNFADTMQTCLTGAPSVVEMIEDLELAGWSFIPHGSSGLDAFAFHTTTVRFWEDLRADASEEAWGEAFRIHLARLRRSIERDLATINYLPFVSDLGGNNFLLLEHSGGEDRHASWNCLVVLSSDLALSQSAEVGRMRTITSSFGRYGEVYEASLVMRAEVGGFRAGEMIVGRLDPNLLADRIDQTDVSARSFYSIYGNTWMLDFAPME